VRKIARIVSYEARADVHRRHGEAADLAAAARHVQLVNRRRPHADRLPDLPEQPARVLALGVAAEDRLRDQRIHVLGGERRGIADRDPAVLHRDGAAEELLRLEELL
jgi:hypothetical protein